jgi:hypothetical protein
MLASAAYRSLVLVGLLVAVTSRADELPPKDAPAYSAVYHLSNRVRAEETEPWVSQPDDTITIAVLGKQSRWDFKSDGHSVIGDAASRSTTTFGGKAPANTAYRMVAPYTPIGWELGYATVAAASKAKPEVLGTKTIAGQPCTNLRFTSEEYGTPEYCVTKTGIVLRFANESENAAALYEAQSITEKAPDKDRFSPPAGYKIEEPKMPTD